MIELRNREDFLTALRITLPLQPNGAEIGVLHGDFSDKILKIVNPKRLFLIDPYGNGDNEDTYGVELNNAPVAYSTEQDYLTLHKKFSKEIQAETVIVLRKYSYEAIDAFVDQCLDFLYIDASHLYEDVKRDLEDWLPKLKTNGILCGHDYIEFDNFGVIQAVNEFSKENGFEMMFLNRDGGDWALRKKDWVLEYARKVYKESKETK